MPLRFAPNATAVLDRVAAPAGSALPLPRLLVVLAHPDDEVLALGGRLERLAGSRLLTVTDGTPRDGADAQHHGFPTLEAYRAARRGELSSAFRHAGLSLATVELLDESEGVPVPDQTASLQLPAITLAVAHAIVHFAPEAVLTHPYEGGHPDHDACAFAVHTAVRLHERLKAQRRNYPEAQGNDSPHPVILEAPFYHAAPDGSMATGTFRDDWTSPATRTCSLSPEEGGRKAARLACFTSQAETLAQFSVIEELFRIAPEYDFTLPPHPGTLFYEQFPWGMQGDRFRTLAAKAFTETEASLSRQARARTADGQNATAR